jgi:hypothetical protein
VLVTGRTGGWFKRRVTEICSDASAPDVWGQNFPRFAAGRFSRGAIAEAQRPCESGVKSPQRSTPKLKKD